jgi:hypothetical protein
LQTRKIQWYRCQPTAKPVGYPHAFASEVWYGREPAEGPGERPHLYTDWLNGSFPRVVPGINSPCGSMYVQQNGWPGPVPMTLPRYTFGLAKCCGTYFDPIPGWVPPMLRVEEPSMTVTSVFQLSTPPDSAFPPPPYPPYLEYWLHPLRVQPIPEEFPLDRLLFGTLNRDNGTNAVAL